MEPPAVRFQKYFKEQMKKFGKTPWVIPFVIAISSGVYYLVTLYASTFCLSGLITPIVLLGLCWYFGIKTVKKLLLIGLVAMLVFTLVYAAAITTTYQNIHYVVGKSDDGKNLTNGNLQPIYGTKTTVYNYSLTVRITNNSAPIDARLLIRTVEFPGGSVQNVSMVEKERVFNDSTKLGHVNFAYNTTMAGPVNTYVFWVDVNGTWQLAADFSGAQALWLTGPMSTDGFAIFGVLLPFALFSTFTSVFPLYALIVLMIWWTRRSRQMRKEQMEKWEAERAKEAGEKPKEQVKVNLQRKAMGLEDAGTFVCSECGADVPADATVCPKCGEKFE